MKTKFEVFNTLNKNLLTEKNIFGERLDDLLQLYLDKEQVSCKLNKAVEPQDILDLTYEWTKIEFNIQEVWGFERNYSFHRFWENPHCTCPTLDNMDRYGTKYHVHSLNCPIHSNKDFMKKIYDLEKEESFYKDKQVENFFKDIN